MPSNRIGRVNEEIQRELSSLIRTVKDPRVADAGMVSVTAVEATPDLKYAKIYVSALNKDSSGQLLYDTACRILNSPDRRREMSRAMSALGSIDAAERIYAAVTALAGRK